MGALFAAEGSVGGHGVLKLLIKVSLIITCGGKSGNLGNENPHQIDGGFLVRSNYHLFLISSKVCA